MLSKFLFSSILFTNRYDFQVLSDPGARQYISGVAVHWYLDALAPVGSLDLTHKNNPDFFIFGTEACAEHIPLLPIPPVLLGDWARAQRYAHDIIQVSQILRFLSD